MVKYLAIAVGYLLVFGLLFGFARRGSRGRHAEVDLVSTLEAHEARYRERERTARAALDLELARALREAEEKKQ